MVRKSVNRRHRQKKQRRSHRKGCAARSHNRQSFQRGGMAPFDYQDALLLDQATRTQAGITNLDQYIADSQVLAKQAGGRRHSRNQKRNRSRNQKRNRSRNQKRNRSQRGGELADFAGSYDLLPASVARGVNPQFGNESSVNSSYGEFKGAQA